MVPERTAPYSVDDLLGRVCRDEREGIPPVLVVVAHPDDEVVGMGSLLVRYAESIFIIHITDGSPRNRADAQAAGFRTRREYARARRRELRAALSLGGIGPRQYRSLAIPDQEAGLHLIDISGRIAEILERSRPGIVFTHPYEGGHPDHDSAAFAVRAAARLLGARGLVPPAILEFSSYHWDGERMRVLTFLPFPGVPECTRPLAPEERELKQRMIECFATQRNTLASFPTTSERYRSAPDYVFARPPHGGTLFYEHFPWGMTGAEWRCRAQSALDTLFPR